MVSTVNVRKIITSRTILERCLIVVVLILASLLLVFIVISSLPFNRNTEKKIAVCSEEACQILGSAIVRSMNEGIDPCQNFYNYSCGRWRQNDDIPVDLDVYGILEILRENVALRNRDLLSNTSEISNHAVENAKQFYSSCMDLARIDKYSVKSLQSFLKEIGGWPVSNQNWKSDNYNALSAIAKIQLRTSFGFGILVSIGVDIQNVSGNILQLDSPSLSLSSEVLLNQGTTTSKTELFNYKQFFKEITKLLGVKANDDLDEHFKEIINVETFFAKSMTPNEKIADGVRMTIHELCIEIPQINWLLFLQDITNSTLLSLNPNFSLSANESITITDIGYLRIIAEYLVNGDNARQIANYLGWRVVLSRMMHLPNEFNEALQEYSKASGFSRTLPERWKVCVSATASAFSDELSHLYIKTHFSEDSKNEVMKLVMDLKFQFKRRLSDNLWMDEKTKKAALLKLANMQSNVGYPPWMADAEEIVSRYLKENKPNMTEDVFQNDLANILHMTKVAILKLRQPNVKNKWTMSPITVNAGYNRNTNTITFPAAFLHEPMYSPNTPKFYNHATLGVIIGHEITHGFDNEGRRRNGSGYVYNWWTKKSEEEFLVKSQCFVNQYNSYGMNGKRTLAENIADNAGIWQAMMEFHRWETKQQQVIQSLPGLQKFSIQQQFFLSYASIWCTKYRPEGWNSTLLYGDHALAPYRLIGSLANLPEFSTAFNCKQNFTKQKCEMW